MEYGVDVNVVVLNVVNNLEICLIEDVLDEFLV